MSNQEIHSFVQKFGQLRSPGFKAHLNHESHAGRAWVGLHVQLGQTNQYLHPTFSKQEGPSRQRHRARRSAACHATAEEVAKDETEVDLVENADAEEAQSSTGKSVDKTDNKENGKIDDNDSAEEATEMELVDDEQCPDNEFDTAQSNDEPKLICCVDLFPTKYKLDGLVEFREKIKEYFENRTEVIEKVLKCEVANYGNNVKLVVQMKVKRGWSSFFFDREANYGDFEGIRSVRHECKDLSNCGG